MRTKMDKMPIFKIILYLIALVSINASAVTPPESTLEFSGGVFSFYTSHSLDRPNSKISRAVIVIHGSTRNADTYWSTYDFLTSDTHTADSTIIIAPHFKEYGDSVKSREWIWDSEGWLKGDQALTGTSMSSFELMDHLMDLLADPQHFPNLKSIVLTGHSAGGQFTQRYALGSSAEDRYPSIHFRYVVANPGSYTYLTDVRAPELSSIKSRCAHYNDYKYGLDHPNAYMGQGSTDTLIQRYIQRDVVYLIGEKDIETLGIDQSCPARLQGKYRLDRGIKFKSILDSLYPSNHHSLRIVPNISHTQWGMYTSPVGREVMGF